MEERISFSLNGKSQVVTTESTRPLLEVLREDLGLMGAKYGCGQAQCGACSVLVDGARVFSCRTAVTTVADRKVTTIEGLGSGEALHAVQAAFMEEGAYQCGYCIPGMIVAATALLAEHPKPTDAQIVEGMNKNVCRCCGYPRIVAAIKRASGQA